MSHVKLEEPRFAQEDFPKLILAILLSSMVTHYVLQVIILVLGGHPDFADTSALMANCLAMSVFLLVGWLLRRVALVSLIFAGLGLAFIVPYLFVLKGPINHWLMQFATYIVLPLGSGTLFRTVCRIAEIPNRPKKQTRAPARVSK